ncbi:MAG: hypothetical protein Q9162_002832 [Coniocarpon cinnabarinum]
MSSAWICAACRRTLNQQRRRARAGQVAHRNASYISLHSRTSQDAEDANDTFEYRPLRRRRRPPGYIDWQFDKSVENDFLQRISESRVHVEGPYSKDRRGSSQHSEELENRSEPSGGRTAKSSDSQAASARVYRRNGTVVRAHPLDLDEPTRQKRPWFGIPRSHTALSDLGYTNLDKDSHRYLNASLNMPSSSGDVMADGPENFGYGLEKQKSKASSGSFFDQYFEQARGPSTPSAAESPAKQALEKLQTAHQLAIPLERTSATSESTPTSNQPSELPNFPGSEEHRKDMDYPEGLDIPGQTTAETTEYNPQKSPSDASGYHVETWKSLLRMNAENKGQSSRTAVYHLCHTAVLAWCESPTDQSVLPKPQEMLKQLQQGQTVAEQARLSMEVLWSVLENALRHSFRTLGEQGAPDYHPLLIGLLELWSSIFKGFAECFSQDAHGVVHQVRRSNDWTSFIKSEQVRRFDSETSISCKARLFEFFPADLHASLPGLDTALLATRVLLHRSMETMAGTERTLSADLKNLTLLLERITLGATVSVAVFQKQLTEKCCVGADAAKMVEEVTEITQRGHAPKRFKQKSNNDSHQQMVELMKKRIGRAIEGGDVGRLDRAWRKIQREYGATEPEAETCASISPQLFAHLLTAYMALGRPNRAVDLWNLMTKAGLTPSIEHWDAMLRGCGMARNAEAVDVLWKNLHNAGIMPDAQLWATRIHSLGQSGRIEAALEAFQAMAREWLKSAALKSSQGKPTDSLKTRSTRTPKPNTQCLNALVAVLARSNRYDQLAQVLAMRKKLGIPADSFTYNPLLRAALRDDDLELASKIVRLMRASGVDPDVATFTMMLNSAFQQDATFGNETDDDTLKRDPADPLQVETLAGSGLVASLPAVTGKQASSIAMVFHLMAKQSLKPTAHTFTTLVTGLLRSQPPNVKAAYGVLRYMSIHDLPLSPQVYTALISHHFEQDPPETNLIDALWQDGNHRHKVDRSLILDAFFYDRVIGGWARCDQPEKALRARNVAKARGKLQSWEALRELLQCLVRFENWAQAQDLVTESREEERAAGNDRARSQRGSAAFWETVHAVGLEQG